MPISSYLRTDDLHSAILNHIEAAHVEINVAQYDIHTHPQTVKNPCWQIFSALIDMRNRGIRVRVLIPPFRFNKSNRRPALYLETTGIDLRVMPDTHPLHAKIFIFDRRAVILGSHNLSPRAFTKNLEASAILTDTLSVRHARDDFFAWWKVGRKLIDEAAP